MLKLVGMKITPTAKGKTEDARVAWLAGARRQNFLSLPIFSHFFFEGLVVAVCLVGSAAVKTAATMER